MKIIDKACRIDNFGSLDSGEVFRFDGTIAMKLQESVTTDDDCVYNAVDLENGEFCYVLTCIEVERLYTELIIK